VVQGEEAGRSSPEVEPAAREHPDTPVSCADTEPEPEMESDTGERAGDGRDAEDARPGYSPRYDSTKCSLNWPTFCDSLPAVWLLGTTGHCTTSYLNIVTAVHLHLPQRKSSCHITSSGKNV
jgi:hypothetical protein